MLSGRGSFITRMLSANSDGSDIRLVSSNGGVSHFIWRDPEHISIWHTGAYRLYKDDGSCENTVQWEADNGHQSYLPDTNVDPDSGRPWALFMSQMRRPL